MNIERRCCNVHECINDLVSITMFKKSVDVQKSVDFNTTLSTLTPSATTAAATAKHYHP